MSLANLRILTFDQYNDLLYRLLSQMEGNKDKPYCDTNKKHLPTIGIGFNLADSHVRANVFDSMGIYEDTQRRALAAVIADPTIRNLPTDVQRDAELQHRLDSVLGRPFVMSDSEIRKVFRIESEKRTGNVKTSSGLEHSLELTAVVSAQYTGVYGPSLRRALASGNRAEAWYEIRYGSNADGKHGKRRYVESALFGLAGENPSLEDAKEAIRMFNRHRLGILTYESRWGG